MLLQTSQTREVAVSYRGWLLALKNHALFSAVDKKSCQQEINGFDVIVPCHQGFGSNPNFYENIQDFTNCRSFYTRRGAMVFPFCDWASWWDLRGSRPTRN
jgi:hypothetical protein